MVKLVKQLIREVNKICKQLKTENDPTKRLELHYKLSSKLAELESLLHDMLTSTFVSPNRLVSMVVMNLEEVHDSDTIEYDTIKHIHLVVSKLLTFYNKTYLRFQFEQLLERLNLELE